MNSFRSLLAALALSLASATASADLSKPTLLVAAPDLTGPYARTVLFVLLLPANIHAAVSDASFNGEAATPLWLRIPEQVLYIAIALWATRAVSAEPAAREHVRV